MFDFQEVLPRSDECHSHVLSWILRQVEMHLSARKLLAYFVLIQVLLVLHAHWQQITELVMDQKALSLSFQLHETFDLELCFADLLLSAYQNDLSECTLDKQEGVPHIRFFGFRLLDAHLTRVYHGFDFLDILHEEITVLGLK
jgi:hypothetical protein